MGYKQGWRSGQWKKLKWKKQIGCMAIGLILGAAAQIQAGAGQDLGQGYELKRNGYGQGEALYQMDVEGLEADPVSGCQSAFIQRKKPIRHMSWSWKTFHGIFLGKMSH